jgi:hypothetical protein
MEVENSNCSRWDMCMTPEFGLSSHFSFPRLSSNSEFIFITCMAVTYRNGLFVLDFPSIISNPAYYFWIYLYIHICNSRQWKRKAHTHTDISMYNEKWQWAMNVRYVCVYMYILSPCMLNVRRCDNKSVPNQKNGNGDVLMIRLLVIWYA